MYTTRPRNMNHVIDSKAKREGQGQMDKEYFDVVATIWTRRFCSRDLPDSTINPLLHATHLHDNVLRVSFQGDLHRAHFFFFFFHLTYSRWTSSLPSCLWSQRIFPSLPGSRLTFFYRDASSALLQLVNQWLNFTYSRSHAFRYKRKNTKILLW